MARTKVTQPLLIHDWAEADAALGKLAELERVIQRRDVELNRAIDQMKERELAYIQPTISAKAQLEKELCLFCDLHRDDFRGAKSRQLNHGLVGYRKSSKISLIKSISEVVGKLRSLGMNQYVIIKPDSVDKKRLATLSDDQLQQIGADRKSKDVFYIETNLDRVKEAVKEG